MPRRGWSTVQVPDGVAIDSRTTSAICEVADEGVSTTQGNSEESSRVSGWPSCRSFGRVRPNIPGTSGGVEEGEVSDPSASGGRAQREPSWNVQKRIGYCHEEVARAQEVLTQAQAKLQSEEQALVEAKLVWPHSRPNQWRRGRVFLQLCQPILLTSWRSCEFGDTICVPNCSVQSEVGERETGSRPRVYRIPLSIWSL